MNVPQNLTYTAEHEWIKIEGDLAIVGITDHAQEQLGDVVYVELPEVGDSVNEGAPFGTVESVKAVSDLFAPLDGEVVEINEMLTDTPEMINSAPYDAWVVKFRIKTPTQINDLLDPTAYQTLLNTP